MATLLRPTLWPMLFEQNVQATANKASGFDSATFTSHFMLFHHEVLPETQLIL